MSRRRKFGRKGQKFRFFVGQPAYAEFQAAMTNPSDALGGQSLYEKYGAKYQDVIDAITKVGEAY